MNRRRDPARLLRWYPPAWRARYGDELAALMDDELRGRAPTRRFRCSIAAAGLREHAHGAGLAGSAVPPTARIRAWSLVVLCAWTPFVVAGASFQKLSEHFDAAVPASSRALPSGAFDAVVAAAALGALLVLVGALAAAPAFVRFLRDGGWSVLRRPATRAAAVSTVVVAGGGVLQPWAHSLSNAQRNGTSGPYGAAVLTWALLAAAALACWTAAAVTVARRLDLTPRVLTLESRLAGGLAAVMATITAATAVWWAAVAGDAPWFLHGTVPGRPGSAFEPRLALTMAVMLAAATAALWAVTRVARAQRALRAA